MLNSTLEGIAEIVLSGVLRQTAIANRSSTVDSAELIRIIQAAIAALTPNPDHVISKFGRQI